MGEVSMRPIHVGVKLKEAILAALAAPKLDEPGFPRSMGRERKK
jgi:hypothetical protein